MKSFSILRTNVGLTTNVKVVVDSNYNLYLDSIESNSDLSNTRYKKFKFTSKNYYDELVPFFFKKTPIDISYDIKYDNDAHLMSSDFSNQYDELYNYGARNIISNKDYREEFEYFAPLYITKTGLPSNFIIFRVDGPGIDLLTKENFTSDITNSLKFVKMWDFKNDNNLSKWLNINFKENNSFPDTPLEIDFKELEFCKWNGIDYETGGYSSKSLFIDDILDEEKEIFELESFIFSNYKNNKIIFPNIINFTFLFDDEPSTPDSKRKWSINRYYGFYLNNLEKVTTISPYITPILKDDVTILEGNILYSESGDPFKNGWSDSTPFYIEYLGEYYIVQRFTELVKNQLLKLPSNPEIRQGRAQITKTIVPNNLKEQYVDIEVNKWKIISELNLEGKESLLNKNYGTINVNNELVDYNNNLIQISDFDKYSIWLIEIDGVYHNLYLDGSSIKVSSDYSFNFNFNEYSYKVGGVDKKISLSVDLQNEPKTFSIYRGTFTDIKDFDTRIVDTEYSKFEYEKKDELTYTDESKMYMENPLTVSDPKSLDDFIWKGEVVNIPVSSEYTANYETFKVTNNKLSDIWRKNPVYCRWSFQNSISANDYPYSLNNSLVFEDFNRSTNPFEIKPVRSERNLDYFYTVNSSTSSYVHHTLHIEDSLEDGSINQSFNFELDKYLNIGTYSDDYFLDFFGKKQYFNNGDIVRNCKKYSYFNSGDKSTPNISLFRGLKFLIFNVDSIDLSNEGNIDKINLSNSNNFSDYKLSILLSDNDTYVDNNGGLTGSNNTMNWSTISDWKMDQTYATGSIVLFDNILYRSLNQNITENPSATILGTRMKSAPYNQSLNWTFETITGSIFYNPLTTYVDDDVIYYYDNYYKYDSTGSDDIWNPNISIGGGYSLNDKVFYKDNWYVSTVNSNTVPPDNRLPYYEPFGLTSSRKWNIITKEISEKWKTIEMWDSIKRYELITTKILVIHNNSVWFSNIGVVSGEEPGVSNIWQKYYSFEPDTDYIYPGTNPIILMNSNYYLCNSNSNNSTLDNGINIYINKKWKNILININISDNTLPNIKNSNRDELYNEVYNNLTAFNFMRAINDINIKYGFTDYVNYIIIKEDGVINKFNYKNNIKSLPFLIRIDEPDELKVKIYSLTKRVLSNPSGLTLKRVLNDGQIKEMSQLNWWSGLPYSMDIIENKFEPKILNLYHGGKNIINESIFRHSGWYMPTFYDIQLFDNKNQKIDIELSDFGIMYERKIQKINRDGSILKFRNNESTKSIYPMIDEFGLTYIDFFIFSSTWDWSYHYETLEPKSNPRYNIVKPTLRSEDLKNFGQPQSYKIENRNNSKL